MEKTKVLACLLASYYVCCWVTLAGAARLQVTGRNLIYDTRRVYLSGVNIAWNSYGYDFGNGAYETNSKGKLEEWLTSISNAGGNSIRKTLVHFDFIFYFIHSL